ncbi:MAG: hypothetical protein IJ019_02425 [Alphaproteobacteria bacterium]|nr:hypothetical protein [Alphaproteobacteria bacterium]
MVDTGKDFLTFLKANYRNDYDKVSKDNVDDALVNAVITKHQAQFDVWKKVPERIRDKYQGRIPDDILEAAKTDNNLTINEVHKIEEERDAMLSMPSLASIYDNPIITGIVLSEVAKNRIAAKAQHMCKHGCSHKNAMILAISSETQKALQEEANSGKITEESKKRAWKQIRDKQQESLKKEYADEQPEKMLANIAKQLNRGKIDKKTALPQMDVLMKKVKEMGREQKLEAYLRLPQSGYNKFNEDNKILFNELMLSHEVGTVSKNLNKVRNMDTKYIPVTEAKTAYVPTSYKAFNQTKIINSKIAQER